MTEAEIVLRALERAIEIGRTGPVPPGVGWTFGRAFDLFAETLRAEIESAKTGGKGG